MTALDGAEAGRALRRAAALAQWSAEDLWLSAFAIGGTTSLGAVTEILAGSAPVSMTDYNNLAVAFNDHGVGAANPARLAMWE